MDTTGKGIPVVEVEEEDDTDDYTDVKEKHVCNFFIILLLYCICLNVFLLVESRVDLNGLGSNGPIERKTWRFSCIVYTNSKLTGIAKQAEKTCVG